MGEEYRTITDGAGWISRHARGRLRFDGRDAGTFLQALLTNDVEHLARGQGAHCAYLTPQGRMIADMDLYQRGDWMLAAVPSGAATALAARFDALVFSEDVQVSDCSEVLDEIACIGGRAAAWIGAALSIDPAELEALAELAQIDAAPGFVARGGDARLPEFRIFAEADAMPAVVAQLEAQGVVPMSAMLVEAMRIEAGRPLFGADMTEETIPLEAGLLERAISTTKGCYVGQEIIVRILHRGGGRVARRLVTLEFEGGVTSWPTPGSALEKEGREVGRVTSVAHSPSDGRVVGLGYVVRDLAEIGVWVRLSKAEHVTARVTGFAH